ncbi:hypothetical protein SAMN04489731_109267 [Amycolatopsis regifaucium]|nr:hypothetical protein SAMN04489731_109267 [Amycolatopsis regifaucium]
MTGPVTRDWVDFWSPNVPKSTQSMPSVRLALPTLKVVKEAFIDWRQS